MTQYESQPKDNFFLYTNVFHCFYFESFEIIVTHSRRQTNTENLNAKQQNSNQNSRLSLVRLIEPSQELRFLLDFLQLKNK